MWESGSPGRPRASPLRPRRRPLRRGRAAAPPRCGGRGLGDARARPPRRPVLRPPAGRRAPTPRLRPRRQLARRARARCRSRRSRARSSTRRRRSPAPSPRRARTPTETHATSPSMHAPTATETTSSARTASDRETGSAPPGSWRYATRRPASAAHTGHHLAVQRTAHHRHAVERRSERAVLLRVPHRVLAGVYGSFITCAPASAALLARASGSRTARRTHRSRARGRAPAC